MFYGDDRNSFIKDDLPYFLLRGSPVRVSDGGSYICLARNDLGSSDEITASVDVRYPARNVRTVPADFLDLEVRRSSSFPLTRSAEPVFVNVKGAQETIPPAYVAWWAGTQITTNYDIQG